MTFYCAQYGRGARVCKLGKNDVCVAQMCEKVSRLWGKYRRLNRVSRAQIERRVGVRRMMRLPRKCLKAVVKNIGLVVEFVNMNF